MKCVYYYSKNAREVLHNLPDIFYPQVVIVNAFFSTVLIMMGYGVEIRLRYVINVLC